MKMKRYAHTEEETDIFSKYSKREKYNNQSRQQTILKCRFLHGIMKMRQKGFKKTR